MIPQAFVAEWRTRRAAAAAFGLSREPTGRVDRVDGHLFMVLTEPEPLGLDNFVLEDRQPGERAFVVMRRSGGARRYLGVASWEPKVSGWQFGD